MAPPTKRNYCRKWPTNTWDIYRFKNQIGITNFLYELQQPTHRSSEPTMAITNSNFCWTQRRACNNYAGTVGQFTLANAALFAALLLDCARSKPWRYMTSCLTTGHGHDPQGGSHSNMRSRHRCCGLLLSSSGTPMTTNTTVCGMISKSILRFNWGARLMEKYNVNPE